MDKNFDFLVLRDIELDRISDCYLQPNKTGNKVNRFVEENANASTKK